MRFNRLLSASLVASTVALGACSAVPTTDAELQSVGESVSIQKSYPRKIYVHMMPWFQVGGQHWSMMSRNSATGVASWYHPLIGEYSSSDPNVIEYQLLTMKYAGIDGVLIDWPGLSGAYDLPQNKASADAIINKTASFGLEFGVVYEDQYAQGLNGAKSDMAYLRDTLFPKPNQIKVNGAPILMVFGPQQFKDEGSWTNILSVFSSKPSFFPLWYNNDAGSNAVGQFAWVDDKGIKSLSDFDTGNDGVDHGIKIPVLYPGFNSYYANGGEPGPTWKVSYGLTQDNVEGGDTFASCFELGKYAGDPIQIATWNDYGEGTMIEPTDQFQYRFLTTLQQKVGSVYTDAELKIVKMLFDQRKQGKPNLDQASTALANLDLATACNILGCTVPVHTGGGSGGATGAGGATGGAGAAPAGGAPTMSGGGAPGAAGKGSTSGGAAGKAGGSSTGGKPAASGGASSTSGKAGAAGADADSDTGGGKCSIRAAGADPKRSSALLLVAAGLAIGLSRRRRRSASAAL